MNIGKALAVSAVAGMILGTVACGGGNTAQPNASDPTASGSEKSSCSGKSESTPSGTSTGETATDPAASGSGSASPAPSN